MRWSFTGYREWSARRGWVKSPVYARKSIPLSDRFHRPKKPKLSRRDRRHPRRTP